MTVGELIKILQAIDPERIVALSDDLGGSAYPLQPGGIDTMGFDEEGYEVYPEVLTAKLHDRGYCEEDVRTDGTPAVVFWP